MSNSATESGQESGGSNGTQGQESGTEGGQGQESGGQGTTTDTGNGGQSGSGESFDLNTITDPNIRAYVEAQIRDAAEARRQAATYRTERNGLQEQFNQYRTERETAEERAQREAAERDQQAQTERDRLAALEQENRTLKIGSSLTEAATAAKAINPATVVRMLQDQVTLDDQGKPQNLQDLITGLKTSDPYLFKRSSSDAGGGRGQGEGSANPANDMNERIRSAFRGGA